MSLSTTPSLNEAERQHALDALHVVGTLPEPAYEDIVQVAAAVCGTPMALVTLLDRETQWFKASTGVDGHSSARNVAVCDHAIRQPNQLFEVGDLANDSRFIGNPLLEGIDARFYAGMPLVTDDGAALGTVCVLDTTPRELNATQRDALKALARLTITLVESRSRERVQQVATILEQAVTVEDAPAPTSGGDYSVVILELQQLDDVSRRVGERTLDRQLTQLDQALEQCLQLERGDSINRVTGSGEFIAVLGTDKPEETLERFERAAEAVTTALGTRLLIGAGTTSTGESNNVLFLRADRALSEAKDAAH